MAVIQYHAVPPSANCGSVRILLKAANIEYEEDNAWGKTRTPEFIAKFPTNLVPAIEHGTVYIAESLAIMRYLCRVFDNAKRFYPEADPVVTSKIDYMCDYINCSVAPFIPICSYPKFGWPGYPGQVESIPEAKELSHLSQKAAAEHLYLLLETKFAGIFLKDSKYLCGDELTIADFRLIPLLSQIKAATKLPDRLNKYVEDMYAHDFVKEVMKPIDGYNERHWA